jgi:hypothetical protein
MKTAIQLAGAPHGSGVLKVEFQFPVGGKLMIDATIRMLSLANQLAATCRRVRLLFDEGEADTMGVGARMDAIGAFKLVPPITSSERRLAYPNLSFD